MTACVILLRGPAAEGDLSTSITFQDSPPWQNLHLLLPAWTKGGKKTKKERKKIARRWWKPPAANVTPFPRKPSKPATRQANGSFWIVCSFLCPGRESEWLLHAGQFPTIHHHNWLQMMKADFQREGNDPTVASRKYAQVRRDVCGQLGIPPCISPQPATAALRT